MTPAPIETRRARVRLLLRLLAIAAAALACVPAAAAATVVDVYPIAGSTMATTHTQITFRGLPISQLGAITVTGSETGVHTGQILADSDGDGGSFMPDKPFNAGEIVTVTTGLDIQGGNNGAFHFTIATPAGGIPFPPRPTVPRVKGDVYHFLSRPDLVPPAVRILKRSTGMAPGYVFAAPQNGPVQWGPEILDSFGHVVWWDPLPGNLSSTDFRVQTYQGQPVLTWWQGQTGAGVGIGQDIIMNNSYQQIATVNAGNGLAADLHEFEITPRNTALITAVHPVRVDATSVHASKSQDVFDAVVQEIDLKTGLVLFQWDSLDHVPLTDSYASARANAPYDYFHLNSVQLDQDGNFIVSSRNTSAAYKIDRDTGAVIWKLGGKNSTFKMGPGTSFAYQHDVEVHAANDGYVTIFNDDGGPPRHGPFSTGLKLRLDLVHKTATLVTTYRHTPGLVANYEGNVQQLQDLHIFVGWGQAQWFTEYSSGGGVLFDGEYIDNNASYRIYKSQWTATPKTSPAIAVARANNGITNVYASWNGATTVAKWRVVGGSSLSSLSVLSTGPRIGFETTLPVKSEAPYFAVQALSSSGAVLATSLPKGTSNARLSIFGHTMFVSPAGVAGLQVGCFSTAPCKLSSKLTAGATTIASGGSGTIAPNSGGIVYFRLTGAGRSMLGKAANHRLPAYAGVHNGDGSSTGLAMTLQPYSTGGSSPARSVTQGSTVKIFARTAFVSPTGLAGIFVGCSSSTNCPTSTTVTVGNTVVAQTKPESVGSSDCGIVYFKLSSAAMSMLSHSQNHQLAATLVARNGSDAATAQIALIGPG